MAVNKMLTFKYQPTTSFFKLESRHQVSNRLFILVDVDDSLHKTKVPTALASRLFNVDITCRSVKPYLNGEIFDSESKKSKNLLKVYHPQLGALLYESEQIEFIGLSISDYISQHMPAIPNNNLREMIIAFNFLALNKEGEIERLMIDQDNYGNFIKERSHLAGFVQDFFPKVSGDKIN